MIHGHSSHDAAILAESSYKTHVEELTALRITNVKLFTGVEVMSVALFLRRKININL